MALTVGGALVAGAALDHGWLAATTPDAGICAGDLARPVAAPATTTVAPFHTATRPAASLSVPTAEVAPPRATTSHVFDPRFLLWGTGLLGLLGLGFVFRRTPRRKRGAAALYPASALAAGAALAPEALYEDPATPIDPWAGNGWETAPAPAARYAQAPLAPASDPSIVWEDAADPIAGLSPIAAWDSPSRNHDRPEVDPAEFDEFQATPEDDTWADLRQRRKPGTGRRKLILAGVVLGGLTALAATANHMEFANATASAGRKATAPKPELVPVSPRPDNALVEARPGSGPAVGHGAVPDFVGGTTRPSGRIGGNHGQPGGTSVDHAPGDPGEGAGPNVGAHQFDALGAGDKVVWDQGQGGGHGQISPSQGGGGSGSDLPATGGSGSGTPQPGTSTSSGGVSSGGGTTSGGSTGNGSGTGASSGGGTADPSSTSGGASSGGGSGSGGSHPGDLIGTDDSGSTGAVDVPEPGTLGLLGAGVVALAVSRSRRFRRSKA